MNKYQKAFIDMSEDGLRQQYELLEEQLQDIYNKFYKDRDLMLSKIANVLLEYRITDDKLNISIKDRDILFKELSRTINNFIEEEIALAGDGVETILKAGASNTYSYTGYLYSLGMDFSMKVLSDKEILKIINTEIAGEIWSKRLWGNTKQLEVSLKDLVYKCFKGEISVNDISSRIRKEFESTVYNTKRLVNTELARCTQGAYDKFCEDNDIVWQIFISTLDSKTSKICRQNDGDRFRFDDRSKPTPPLHPNCRSALVILPNEDYEIKTRRDNETKEIIPFLTYSDWLKNK